MAITVKIISDIIEINNNFIQQIEITGARINRTLDFCIIAKNVHNRLEPGFTYINIRYNDIVDVEHKQDTPYVKINNLKTITS
jgi:SMC interacting uncharacterized protein involved in chromosome segregation